MDEQDIKEIIKTQLLDIGINANNTHYNIAINYYRDNNCLPDIGYIVAIITQDNENNNRILQPENVIEEDVLNERIVIEIPVENDINITNQNNTDNENDTENNDDNNDDNDDSNDDNNDDNNQEIQNSNSLTNAQNDNIINELAGIENNINQLQRQVYSVNQLIAIRNTMNDNQVPDNMNMVDVIKVIKNIDSIPLFMYKDYHNNNSNSECLICYDPFVATDIIRALPCTHVLHRCCIDDHLKTKSYLCPYCKSPTGDYVYKNL
ncbi:putative ORFan [Tupanvirus deep ocean]|uniref:ORFan n=2 Tax=Tupanvirus TaxID=2094720 RepID=A0AC62A802_9VIRU|nr:putative ORFan [Tupanvirus deep ocean]QKU33891.1 putative ORFan [Tupanvirus deep ocean]